MGGFLLKNIYKITMVIMGTIIGAGFASGREIYIFFEQYGIKGLIGIILSGILTGFIIYKTLTIIKNNSIYNYEEFLQDINKNHNKINRYIKIIVNSFLMGSFFIMVAAFSAFIKQNYGIAIYISSGIFSLICYIVFEKSLNGIMKINSFLVPFLLIFILIIGIKNVSNLEQETIYLHNRESSFIFIISSMLYTSYNSIILIPVLVSMKNYIVNTKQIKYISILSSIIIIILSLLIFFLLLGNNPNSNEIEMPMVQNIKKFGNIYLNIYSFIIIASIYTSAISAGYSFLKNVSKTEKTYKINLTLICIASIFVSKIGFTNLVSILYPIFGVLGMVLIFCIFKTNK